MTAALQLIRCETLEQIGLYDEGYRICFEDLDYCLRVFEAGLDCIYEPSVARHRTARSSSAARPTPEIERWTRESTRPHAACWGTDDLSPLGPGDAVTEIPKTLFMSRGNNAVAWYRCALPALALGADWTCYVGEPPQRPLRLWPHRARAVDRGRHRLRGRRRPAAARRRLARARSATGRRRGVVVLAESTTGCAASRKTRPRLQPDVRPQGGRGIRALHAGRRRHHLLDAVARRALRVAQPADLRVPQRDRPQALRADDARARLRRHRLGRARPATSNGVLPWIAEVTDVMRAARRRALRQRRPALRARICSRSSARASRRRRPLAPRSTPTPRR